MYSPSTLQRVLGAEGRTSSSHVKRRCRCAGGGGLAARSSSRLLVRGARPDWRPGAACSALGVMLAALLVVASVSIGSVAPTSFRVARFDAERIRQNGQGVRAGLVLHRPALQVHRVPDDAADHRLRRPARSRRDGAPIQTRTGQDRNDPDSGGQPPRCVALQYVLQRQHVGEVPAFGSAYQARHALLARSTIANIAQQFEPTEFWTRRERFAGVFTDGAGRRRRAARACAPAAAARRLPRPVRGHDHADPAAGAGAHDQGDTQQVVDVSQAPRHHARRDGRDRAHGHRRRRARRPSTRAARAGAAPIAAAPAPCAPSAMRSG